MGIPARGGEPARGVDLTQRSMLRAARRNTAGRLPDFLTGIEAYRRINRRSPSLAELAALCGLANKSSAAYHVDRLVALGLVGRGANLNRTLHLTPRGRVAVGELVSERGGAPNQEMTTENP